MYKSTRKFFLAIGVFLLMAFLATINLVQAQVNGISGKVVDPIGSPIKKASISLISAKQVSIAKTESSDDGQFSFSNIPNGNYVLEVSQANFGTKRFVAEVSESGKEIELKLEINSFTDEVTITAELGQAQNTDEIAQSVNVISSQAIQQRATAVLAQVANEEVGLSLQRTSPTIGAIFIRGLTGKNVAVYVDGVRYTTSTGRGGINTFFDLNEPTSLKAIEVLRGPNSAQYGSDSLGGTIQLVSQAPLFGADSREFHGKSSTSFTSSDSSFSQNLLLTYGTKHFGILTNFVGRRVNTLRPAKGLDSHAAVTRFLGLPSNIFGDHLPDTAFTQYGGTVHLNYAPTFDNQFTLHYQRNQQDGGKRYDQLLGGDGNLIADLRNLMGDFFYARYDRQKLGFFDTGSFTFSFNGQREERVNQGGQGNPLASITSQYERTRAFGFNFQLAKQVKKQNYFLIGSEFYREKVTAPAFTFSPSSKTVTASRPRIPNGARYLTYAFYLQDSLELIPNKVRLSGALRYGVASYESRASRSPLVKGMPLFPDDSLRADDFSGRVGIVIRPTNFIDVVFNYSRGFRAPNVTDLGTLGLTGDGFEIASTDIANLGGTIGSTADDKAISTGIAIAKQKSEVSNNFDLGLRIHNRRFDTDLTGFIIDINDAITKQALILPQGAVGKFLGDQPIIRQLPNGVVFVPLSATPVLLRANFSDARIFGIEYKLSAKLTSELSFSGNFTYLRAKDKATGKAPNIEGGTPAPTAFLSLRYAPSGKNYWIEAYSTLAGEQERLSSLDLSDRRTGASRSRTSIANFFNNGARVRGLIAPGLDGRFGTSDDKLIATGETLTQVQNRLLGSAMSAPAFPRVAGYGLIGLRGGIKIRENSELLLDFQNIGDKGYRGISWGIDGPGRSASVTYKFSF